MLQICAKHFQRADIRIASEKSRLKPNAIPSIFPWTEADKKRQRNNRRQSEINTTHDVLGEEIARELTEQTSGTVVEVV